MYLSFFEDNVEFFGVDVAKDAFGGIDVVYRSVPAGAGGALEEEEEVGSDEASLFDCRPPKQLLKNEAIGEGECYLRS